MIYLFQSDDYMRAEKRIIRQELSYGNLPLSQCIQNTSMDNLEIFIKANYQSELLNMVPVGTVEFNRKFMKILNISEPECFCYPEELKKFMKREIYITTYEQVPLGYFCKPKDVVKLFTGDIKTKNDITIPKDTKVYMCEPINLVAEYRYYILKDRILGFGRYDDHDDEDIMEPDLKYVQEAVNIIYNSKNTNPCGYSLDFGITDTNKSLLIEANDGWSLGYYKGSCSPKNYLDLITNRWQEIVSKQYQLVLNKLI